jgi:hypothetical protein
MMNAEGNDAARQVSLPTITIDKLPGFFVPLILTHFFSFHRLPEDR